MHIDNMEIYSKAIKINDNVFDKIFYAIRLINAEYKREVVTGFNLFKFDENLFNLFSKSCKFGGCKIYYLEDCPISVFAYNMKQRLCDISVHIEKKGNQLKLIIFSGNGYPLNSYKLNQFYSYFNSNEIKYEKLKGRKYKLSKYCAITTYLKKVFNINYSKISFVESSYGTYYFFVNKKYYFILNNKWTNILNFSSKKILNYFKTKLFVPKYCFKLNDSEFDVFSYMLSRKIACAELVDGSIIFSRSYYKDSVTLINYLEFLCSP